jgi:signal transduction histidine kinase
VIYVEIIGQMINFRKNKARLVLAKDITDKLNADMEILNLNAFLIEQNEKLKEYGHIYSHQIRGPLASVMGLVNLMKEDSNYINKEMLEMMDDACNRLDKEIRYMNNMLIEIERRSEDVSR